MESIDTNYIELNHYEATILNDILNRKYRIFDPNYCIFTYEELARIKSVTIEGMESISFLKYLPNLEVLNIISSNYLLVYEDSAYDQRYYNNIDTQELNSVLNKLTNLRELTIKNDITITSLDLTNNKKIEKLNLENNPELNEIIGLDDLHNLKEIKLFGNNIKRIKNFDAFIFNTLDANTNIIDLSFLFSALNEYSNIETKIKYLEHLDLLNFKGLFNITFSEKNGMLKYNTIDFAKVEELTRNTLNYLRN